jgi:hypothetical protein
MEDPQPFGPAFFVIRDNDPAVDGFLVSRNVDVPFPVQVAIPGLAPIHDLDFLVTYPDTTVPSLDLLDAVGSYDFTGISVFGWTIGLFGGIGAEYIYDSMTIEAGPGPPAATPRTSPSRSACSTSRTSRRSSWGSRTGTRSRTSPPPSGVFDLADVQRSSPSSSRAARDGRSARR